MSVRCITGHGVLMPNCPIKPAHFHTRRLCGKTVEEREEHSILLVSVSISSSIAVAFASADGQGKTDVRARLFCWKQGGQTPQGIVRVGELCPQCRFRLATAGTIDTAVSMAKLRTVCTGRLSSR